MVLCFVRCGVLKEALATIDQDCQESAEVLERTYQRHRERTQGVAARKHCADEFDKARVILVRPADL